MQKKQQSIAVYSRKSKFTGKGESIGNQIELCREYIRTTYGMQALEHIILYEDEGFSGENLHRPAFQKMMNAAKQHKLEAIVVYRLDRISRNVSDFSSLIEELSRLHISFISITEHFDTFTPMGRAMMSIASVFAQLERETIAERIRDNMHELAKTGCWLGGITPTGYTSETIKSTNLDGKTISSCKLKLIPKEADTVRMIYELYIERGSLTAVEAELMQRGIKTKNGKYFTRFSIKAILQNPVYVIADDTAYDYFASTKTNLFSDKNAFDGVHGMMAYNRTKQKKRETTQHLPPSEWIVAVGHHFGIVSGKTWVSVQKMLERSKCKSYRTPRKNTALLTGLLYCSCGSRMYPKQSSHTNQIFMYMCKCKEHSKRSLCHIKNANGNLLDAAVMEQLKSLTENKEVFLQQLQQYRKYYSGKHELQLSSLQTKSSETTEKIMRLVDSLAGISDSITRHYVEQRIEQLHQEQDILDSALQELKNAAQNDDVWQRFTSLKSCLDEMGLEQKRAAVRSLVQKVVWDGENAHVVLLGASLSLLCEDSK